MAEWFLFLPQVRMGIDDIVVRARAAEHCGFDGIALIDHLEPPGAAHQSIWEAMTVATWVAARTETLRIGHLVLCDGFRHPAVLASKPLRSRRPRAAGSSLVSAPDRGRPNSPASVSRTATTPRRGRDGSPVTSG
jgi:Luciferase-like monooxygenase